MSTTFTSSDLHQDEDYNITTTHARTKIKPALIITRDHHTVVIRNSLKGSLKGRHANNAKAVSRGESAGIIHLNSIIEWNQYSTPRLEHDADLIYCSPLADDDEVQVFEASLLEDSTISCANRFFHIPIGIRHKVYSYCFPHEHRKISLSPAFATKAVFDKDHFATAWDVTADVLGGLESFRALRHELLTYFWSSYRFHVTLTPFSGCRFSPLDQIWLRQNLHIVQNLTVEFDYTKFGGSTMKLAPAFGHHMELNERMLNDVVSGLVKRRGTTIMKEFHIMCRRYAGFRPQDDSSTDTGDCADTPYCPENTTFICGAISDMRGMLKTCRLSGFPQEYTKMMLQSLYSQGNTDPDWSVAEESPWPRVNSDFSNAFPNPSASTCTLTLSKTSEKVLESVTISMDSLKASEVGSSETRLISSSTHPSVDLALQAGLKPSGLILQLTRSQSFRQGVEEQMIKSTLCPDFKLGECIDDSLIECLDLDAAASHYDNYQTTRSTSPISKPQQIESPGKIMSSTAAIPRSTDFQMCNHENFFASTLKPISQMECVLSHSLYTMNRINEQDPAFQRTLSAVRKRQDLAVLHTMPTEKTNYKIRPVLSYDTKTKLPNACRGDGSTGTKRRYLAFVNKFHSWTI